MKKNRFKRIYLILSMIMPFILLYPAAIAWNLHGEGVMGGSAEFLPEFLYQYALWGEVQPENYRTAVILSYVATFIIGLFYLSLVNFVVVAAYLAVKVIKKIF